MAKIAELFGQRIGENPAQAPQPWKDRHCPFTNRTCDVTANRSDRAILDLEHSAVSPEDKTAIENLYGTAPIPVGICSIFTARQNEALGRPWIVCPKRMMELRAAPPVIPNAIRELIPINPGTKVRCWWEFKLRSRASALAEAGESPDARCADADSAVGGVADPEAVPDNRFFEYTFDYILIPVEQAEGQTHPKLIGPPYVLEVMTSSTRGGGLTEHMVDLLTLREQGSLRGRVKSPYTPNYRQVFERMLGQFYAKAEIAESWGGRAIWIVQDVLLDYIEQSTDFRAANYPASNAGNVFVAVFRMDDANGAYSLAFDRVLRGDSRPRGVQHPDFTTMLGLGHAPTRELLFDVLERTQERVRRNKPPNWIDFIW